MKRSIIALIMALAMILTLVACGNSNGDNNNGGNDVKAIQLSLGHTNNTDHHYQVLAESFKKIVEEVHWTAHHQYLPRRAARFRLRDAGVR